MADSDICNAALKKIGQMTTISSLASAEKNALVCNQFYASVIAEILVSYPWNCAIAREELAAPDPEPDNNTLFQYQYDLPSDSLRILDINNDRTIEFMIEGSFLYTNVESCIVRYIKQETDDTLWHPLLKEAIVNKLASEIAVILTGKQSLSSAMFQKYMLAINHAKLINAIEEIDTSEDTTQWDNI